MSNLPDKKKDDKKLVSITDIPIIDWDWIYMQEAVDKYGKLFEARTKSAKKKYFIVSTPK